MNSKEKPVSQDQKDQQTAKEIKMPITITDRYKLILEEHHYSCDFRIKIIRGWCWIYSALAAVFVWVQNTCKALSYIISAAAFLVTVFMWIADIRNRSGIRAAKDVGEAIETDTASGIPKNQQYFARLQAKGLVEKILTHSWAINAVSILLLMFFAFATVYLYVEKGVLPH